MLLSQKRDEGVTAMPLHDAAPPVEGTLESALYARDLDACESFYRGILGLPVVAHVPGRHVFFRVAESMLLVFDPRATSRPARPGALPVPPHGSTGAGHFCLRVAADRLDDWRRHLAACGVDIEADFRWPNGARSIYLRDPAGNSIELSEAALWA